MKIKGHVTLLLGAMIGAIPVSSETLRLKDYIQIVLKHNPQPQIASGAVQASSASSASARSRLLPQVNGNASISRSESPGTSARVGGPDNNSAAAGIGGQILLFDFGKTRYQYNASRQSLSAAEIDSQSTMASVILLARSAYFNYLLSLQLLNVNEDALKQANEHLDQAKTLFDVGKQARIEVTKARVDVANAGVNLIHAKNSLKLAKVQMDLVAGMPLGEPMVLIDSLSAFEDSIGMSEALKQAMQLRPEILSSQARMEAARLQLKSARAAYLPSLSATGSLGWDAQDNAAITGSDFNGSPNWSIGAALSVPIYQGGAIGASVNQADAAFKQAQASLDATTQNVAQQVQQYFLQGKEALQRIDATGVLIEQADESLKMSQERYRAGVATSIEITDAEVTLANARISNAQALFDYHIAHANLLLAIGGLHE
jgi:outer membrane protein